MLLEVDYNLTVAKLDIAPLFGVLLYRTKYLRRLDRRTGAKVHSSNKIL